MSLVKNKNYANFILINDQQKKLNYLQFLNATLLQ